jgi:hypothetical protein
MTNRMSRKTAILTETSEKQALEAEEATDKKKKINKGKIDKVNRNFSKKNNLESLSDEEDNALCLYCEKPYSCDVHGEKWIQCHQCKG